MPTARQDDASYYRPIIAFERTQEEVGWYDGEVQNLRAVELLKA